MKWNPLWIYLFTAILWAVFLSYVEPILALSETKDTKDVLLFAISMTLLVVFTLLPALFWCGWKQDKKRAELEEKIDRDTNPKYAKRLRYNGRTPTKGDYVVVLDEDNWVVLQWDKNGKNGPWMAIFTPPSHEDRINRIAKQWENGKFEEVLKVRIEDLPRIS